MLRFHPSLNAILIHFTLKSSTRPCFLIYKTSPIFISINKYILLPQKSVCVCVCVWCVEGDVFVPAYKPRIYPWLNTDEARIFDKARTSSLRFFTRLTLEGTRPHIPLYKHHPRFECAEQKFVCDFFFFFFLQCSYYLKSARKNPDGSDQEI